MMPKDLIIGLERTMCPGACPDYSLFIHGDGKIVYEGRQYVAAKGKHERQISRAQIRQILDEFYRISYFSLKDRHDAVAIDGAITKTSIVSDSRKKEVVNCHPSQALEDLYQLEKIIDESSQSKRWVRNRSGQRVLSPDRNFNKISSATF